MASVYSGEPSTIQSFSHHMLRECKDMLTWVENRRLRELRLQGRTGGGEIKGKDMREHKNKWQEGGKCEHIGRHRRASLADLQPFIQHNAPNCSYSPRSSCMSCGCDVDPGVLGVGPSGREICLGKDQSSSGYGIDRRGPVTSVPDSDQMEAANKQLHG